MTRVASSGVPFAVAAAACWGFGVVIAKAGLDRGVSPNGFAVIQLATSVVVLCAATWGRGVLGAFTPATAGSGVLEYALGAMLVVAGLALTTAGNAAIISAAEPVLMVLAATLLLRERVRRTFLLPMAMLVVGLLATVAPDLASAGAPRAGDLLVLASAVAGAIYAVLSRRLVGQIAPLPLAFIQQATGLLALAAAVALATLLGATDDPFDGLLADRSALALAVASGLLSHGAAVWLHLIALERMPASTFAIYLGLVPLFALSGGVLLLGEAFGPPQIAGGALVVLAAFLSTRMTNTEARP